MTNEEALALQPDDRIRMRPHVAGDLHGVIFFVERVRATVNGRSVSIVTTTMLHLAPWEIERAGE